MIETHYRLKCDACGKPCWAPEPDLRTAERRALEDNWRVGNHGAATCRACWTHAMCERDGHQWGVVHRDMPSWRRCIRCSDLIEQTAPGVWTPYVVGARP